MRSFDQKTLGETVAKHRKRAGMTQEQLAEKNGVSNVFISNVERGKKKPKLETVCSLSGALNTSCDALLYDGSPDAHLTTIKQLLAGRPSEYIEGIENMIRVCNMYFLNEDDDLAETDQSTKTDEAGRNQG